MRVWIGKLFVFFFLLRICLFIIKGGNDHFQKKRKKSPRYFSLKMMEAPSLRGPTRHVVVCSGGDGFERGEKMKEERSLSKKVKKNPPPGISRRKWWKQRLWEVPQIHVVVWVGALLWRRWLREGWIIEGKTITSKNFGYRGSPAPPSRALSYFGSS